MFDVGGAGRAILFVSALVGGGLAGLIWAVYASHCFLTVLTESSVGETEVRWPDESILDWWWKPFYCLAMLSFWLTTTGVIAGVLILVSPWAFAAAVAVLTWYGFPIGLMCVMDARNSLAVVHLPLFVRLAGHLPAVLFVGLITLPLGVIAGGAVVGVLFHSGFWAIPAALVIPPAMFIYSRCWGRLAWMVLNFKARKRKGDAAAPLEAAQARSHDPWAMPEEEIPEVEVAIDEPPPDPEVGDEWGARPAPYVMSTPSPAEAEAAAAERFDHAKYYADYRKREELRRARAEGRTPFEKKRRGRATFGNAFGKDLLPFLFHWRTIRAAVTLGTATLVFLVLLRFAVLVAPTAS